MLEGEYPGPITVVLEAEADLSLRLPYNGQALRHKLPSRFSRAALLWAPLFMSCSASVDGGATPESDARHSGPDAVVTPRSDASSPTPCLPAEGISDGYSDTILEDANDPWNDAENYWEVSANLEEAGGPSFELRLRPGRGQLADPITPGTYSIGANDSRFEDCALCVYVTVEGAGGTSYFMADSGTLTLSTIAFGSVVDVIEGELIEATLRSIELVATGPDCQPGDSCGNTSCGANGKCLVQQATQICGTTISQLRFRTP